MPVVKILIFPDIDSDLDKQFSFSFRHYYRFSYGDWWKKIRRWLLDT
jgi:hypothetical protein